MKREYGGEQPYIPLGPFKMRLPIIHHEWQWTECLAAMFLGVACLGAGVGVTMNVFGIENFYIALTFGVLNGACYYLPALLGDPVVPGWITPALPLTINYLSAYAIGPERIHAMIALQMLVAFLFLVMGTTGIGRKLVQAIPNSIKAGIVIGSGISAGINVLNARIPVAPYTVVVCIIIAYIFLFSKAFLQLAERNSFWKIIRNQGIVPAQLFAIILAPIIFKEIPSPKIEWGLTPLNFSYVLEHYTIFGLGMPSIKIFIAAIPMAFTAYIIAFSDFILAKEIVEDATANREDEKVEFDPGRSNLVSALRNAIMSVFAPWVPLCGPLWASGLLTITERYKRGYSTLRTYWGGVGTFRAATVIAVMMLPLVTLIKPAFGIFFGLTMAVQAYACGNIGMKMADSPTSRGIATVMGVILAMKGPSLGILSGIILWAIIESQDYFEEKRSQQEKRYEITPEDKKSCS
ncbi:membrane protein [Fusobacterium necrophorum BL]|uniref:Membrane protein n=1 Tax=Fusobacterium necrophorum BL TaxID=1441732 RepID=A0AB73BZ58_9FUSO|nr:membrane protein [Fusobacterium necrophorum BL]